MKFTKWLLVLLLASSVLFLGAKSAAQSYTLGMVQVKFCTTDEKSNEVDSIAKAGEKLPICLEFTNKATDPITINIDFLDSIITDDKLQNRACNAADRPKKNFGNFVSVYEKTLELPAKQTIQKTYMIKYPIGFSWLSHGCLAYNIVGENIQNDKMFSIVLRSVKFIDILVTNTKPIQVIKVSQRPKIIKIGDEYQISFWLKNKGNVQEKISITTILSNGIFEKEFIFDTIIPKNTWMIFTTPTFILPFYKWIFFAKNKITYEPKFDFDLTNKNNSGNNLGIYKGGTKTILKFFFVWSWQSVVFFLFLLLLLTLIIKKRIKK